MNRPHAPAAIGPAAVAALCIALLVAPAPAGAVSEAAYGAAMTQFLRGLDGESSAVDAAATQWQDLSAAEPADPVLRAYAGAAVALRARTTLLPWRKMSLAEDGLAQVDKALAQLTAAHDAPLHLGVPASLETRFVAGRMFLDMPAFFNRGPKGAKLLAEVANSPLLAGAPLAFRGAVWLQAGLEAAKASRTEEARQWLRRVSESGAPQAPAAQAKLKEL